MTRNDDGMISPNVAGDDVLKSTDDKVELRRIRREPGIDRNEAREKLAATLPEGTLIIREVSKGGRYFAWEVRLP